MYIAAVRSPGVQEAKERSRRRNSADEGAQPTKELSRRRNSADEWRIDDAPADTPAGAVEVVGKDLEAADFGGVFHVGTGTGADIVIPYPYNPKQFGGTRRSLLRSTSAAASA